MPFARPTLTDLRQLALQDVYAALGVRGLLRFSVLRVLSWVQAGMAHLHYGYLDWISRESVPFTSTDEYIEAWAGLVGIFRKPAAASTGTVVVTGTAGVVISVGTVLRRAGDAAGYTTSSAATIGGGGTVAVAVSAQVPGAASNADADTAMAFGSPITGVTGVALSGPLAGGADVELDAPFRTRMLQRWAAAPQGGDAADYVQWALAVPGVTRAWCRPLGAGAGSVTIYTMWDQAEASHNGFPQGTNGVATAETRDTPAAGDQLAVANAIYPLRPVTALVYSVAPTAYGIGFTIHPATSVNGTVQALVNAAIDDVFVALATPLNIELQISPFENAIAAVPGMPDFTLSSPASPILAPMGALPVRGSVTYA